MKSENIAEAIGRMEGKDSMFVVIADIELKEGAEAKFVKWFSQSNRNILSKIEGFVERKLLKSPDGRQLRIVLTCANKESFLGFYQSSEHMAAHQEAMTFMSRPPQMSFYHMIA